RMREILVSYGGGQTSEGIQESGLPGIVNANKSVDSLPDGKEFGVNERREVPDPDGEFRSGIHETKVGHLSGQQQAPQRIDVDYIPKCGRAGNNDGLPVSLDRQRSDRALAKKKGALWLAATEIPASSSGQPSEIKMREIL
ncbi:MAG: hypothetical protein ABSD20_12145, partial [Terriglobales bacterium]